MGTPRRTAKRATAKTSFSEGDRLQKDAIVSALKADPRALIRKEVIGVDAPAGDGPLKFKLSDATPDRVGDSLAVKGWLFDNYRKNPVVLFGHNQGDLPVAKSLREWTEGNAIWSEPEYADHEFAQDVERLVRNGFLNAVSVGFRPLVWKFNEERPGFSPIDFEEQELLEYSNVPVPCHPGALLGGKAAQSDMETVLRWAEQLLAMKKGSGFWMSQAQLERLAIEGGGNKAYSFKLVQPTGNDDGPAADPAPIPNDDPTDEPQFKAGDSVMCGGKAHTVKAIESDQHFYSVQPDDGEGTSQWQPELSLTPAPAVEPEAPKDATSAQMVAAILAGMKKGLAA